VCVCVLNLYYWTLCPSMYCDWGEWPTWPTLVMALFLSLQLYLFMQKQFF